MTFPFCFPGSNGGTPPSLAGFTNYVRNSARIGASFLPDGSPYFRWMYDQALNIVNTYLAVSPGQHGAYAVYTIAVYALGTHLLIEFAEDAAWTIGTASWANPLVTLTLTGGPVPYLINPGDPVAVSGVSPIAYDAPSTKPWVVNSIDQTTGTVTYVLAVNPGAGTVLPGALLQQTYFFRARQTFKLNQFVPGLVNSAGDQGTSVGLVTPKFAENIDIAALDYTKTPWGRLYLSYAMRYGSLWGLT